MVSIFRKLASVVGISACWRCPISWLNLSTAAFYLGSIAGRSIAFAFVEQLDVVGDRQRVDLPGLRRDVTITAGT
jgi:hypothetical protein